LLDPKNLPTCRHFGSNPFWRKLLNFPRSQNRDPGHRPKIFGWTIEYLCVLREMQRRMESTTSGVHALQRGDHDAASKHFGNAARGGHVSAFYNLSLLWGGGSVTPYDFDLAADCWYKAAEAGHPSAKDTRWLLEAADRGGFGADNLAKFAEKEGPTTSLVPQIMICAARFCDVVCRKHGATVDVIAYELDAAAKSDFDFVHSFIKRTGIEKGFYEGGIDRLKTGSAADQITDGLNKLHVARRSSGVSEKLAIMARCSIVGYIIAKSPYGDRSQPLRGVDTFFADIDQPEVLMSLKDLFGRKPSGFIVGDVHLPKLPENDDEITLMTVEITKRLL
jgi:hypothetical protein